MEKLHTYISTYREHGHHYAKLDPLELYNKYSFRSIFQGLMNSLSDLPTLASNSRSRQTPLLLKNHPLLKTHLILKSQKITYEKFTSVTLELSFSMSLLLKKKNGFIKTTKKLCYKTFKKIKKLNLLKFWYRERVQIFFSTKSL